ncbi:hypothetical protein JY651_12485 [Pyxidicoccus parkwayensis]|uniref:Muconolactone isomerase domain-containing protein n=1 Tax=Pyxidicoccus parkwayensis TaxID=2813578 RepID=A0ABX7P5C9_9BACT|nr:hypothetical protein [Pyxidicoccus parkwaysis]QSQ25690.1 hypothetical protein JY651_12485 [Pyxidicoccus parkwaysis]
MKFLIIARDRPNGPYPPDPTALNRAVRDWVGARLADGTFDCAYYLLPRAGMCIANAESHEALLTLMRAWPSFGYQEFEVHMLADARHGIDDNHARMKRDVARLEAEGQK